MSGVLDVVVGRVDLARSGERVLAADVVASETSRVHLPGVESGPAVHDPLRDEPAHPARARKAVRAEAGGDPEAAHLRRPEDELVVRGESFRSVDQTDDLRVSNGRCPHYRVGHQRLEPIPIRLQEPSVEVGRYAVQAPRCGIALVAAHDQAAGFGPVVHEQRGVSHRRHVQRQARRFGDEVLVCHRDERHVDAHHAADLGSEHAARVDHKLSLDVAPLGDYPPDPVVTDFDVCDAGVLADLGAAAARTLDQREGELARVDITVGRQERRSEDALGRHRREHALRLLRRDQLEWKAECLCPPRLACQLFHSLLARGQPQRSDLAPPGF